MSTEALVLAATTVIRPTSSAAVLAMLATRRPQTLLVAYILAGLAFSLAVGTLVVVLLGGLHSTSASRPVRPLLDLLLGVSALVYAATLSLGRGPRRISGPATHDGWMRRRLTNLSPPGAAAAGVFTHLPGVVYLAALNAIAASATGTADGMLQVVLYNAIWFSLAILALALSVYRPTVPRELLEPVVTWAQRNMRMITIGFCGGLGGYLLVVGVLGLARGAS
jgi:hypothetical protein